MNHEFTIWQRSHGDPRHFHTNEGSSNGKFDGKFIGKYTFPFSFPFPSHLNIQKRSTIPPDNDLISPFPALAALLTPPSLPPPRNLMPPDHETRKPGGLPWIAGPTSSAPASSSNGTSSRPLPSVRLNIDSIASRIPPSFLEKSIPATIVYEFSVIIAHGRFKADNK